MGKLRKIGRKVTRALSKVFGKKLGSLIGGIGLSMVMWGGAKVLFPGLTSAISQQVTNLKNNVFGTPTEAVVEVKEVLSDDVIAKAKQTDVTGGATGKVEGDITEFVDFTDGSNLVPTNALINSSKGTPYCNPSETAIAKLFIKALTNSPSLLVSINISPILPSSYSPVCK